MRIIKKVFNNKFSLKYYGLDDMVTGLHLNALFEYEHLLKDYLSLIDYRIDSEDSFCDYLALTTISKYQEIVTQLANIEDKPKLQRIVNLSNEALEKYELPLNQIYELINNSYYSLLSDVNEIDDYNRYEFYDIVLDYIFKQHNRVKNEVFLFVEKEHWGYIFNNFSSCISYYKQHINELDNLIDSIYIEEEKHPFSNLNRFLSEYKMNVFDSVFKKHVVVLSDKALSLVESVNEDNYINVCAYCEDIIKLAKQYDLKKHINKFEKLMPKLYKTKEAYLKKHGKEYKEEIPVKEIIDKLREDLSSKKGASNLVLLGLTHTKLTSNYGYEASINTVFDLPRSPIFDYLRHIGLETNTTFTASVQNQIRWIFGFHNHLFGLIINDKDLSDILFKVLSKVLEIISKEYGLDYLDLNNELNGIIDSIVYLFSIDATYPYYRTFCFGLSQSICSYIEKILRKVFIEKYDDDILYIPESTITLGNLLKAESIRKLFGDRLISIIRYELHFIEEKEKGLSKIIGMNLRNKLMHNNDIDYMSEIHTGLVIHLFYILVIIIHQLETTIIKFVDE